MVKIDLDAKLLKALDVAKQAASAGGEVLRRTWSELLEVTQKSHRSDLVTNADVASEKAILDILQKACPEYGILAEEAGQLSEGAEYQWVIDPLDGTTNYVHHLPVVAISIALVRAGRPELAVIYQPLSNELFCAASGQGATLNGNPISVSSTERLEASLLATGFAYDRVTVADNNYLEFCHMTHLSQGVRRLGAAALDLAYVAAGRFDGFWERGLQPWDMAAGALLVEEAGGAISAYDGSAVDLNAGRILASNGRLHKAMQQELAKVSGWRSEHPIKLPE